MLLLLLKTWVQKRLKWIFVAKKLYLSFRMTWRKKERKKRFLKQNTRQEKQKKYNSKKRCNMEIKAIMTTLSLVLVEHPFHLPLKPRHTERTWQSSNVAQWVEHA